MTHRGKKLSFIRWSGTGALPPTTYRWPPGGVRVLRIRCDSSTTQGMAWPSAPEPVAAAVRFSLGARGSVSDSPQGQVGSERPPVPGEPDALQLRFHPFLEESQNIHVSGNPGPQHPGPVRVGEHPQTGKLERKRFAGAGRGPLRRQDILNPFPPEYHPETGRVRWIPSGSTHRTPWGAKPDSC